MGVQLQARLRDRGTLTRGLDRRIAAFEASVKAAEAQAAKVATDTTRASFRRARPIAPARPRRQGSGQMSNLARWRQLASGGVGFNVAEMDKKARHWIIQEIGTNARATIKVGGTPRPTGRPAKGATYVRTVKSQVGRRISSGLVFASGPSGQWSRPGAASGQQLYLRSKVKGVPFGKTNMRSQAGIIIGKEIEGQHFVRKGGRKGFRTYRTSVLAAARQQFSKSAT